VKVEGKTYEASGVSLELADSIVERLRSAVESTGTTGFGAFAGLYPLDEQRFLAASTDGVGTKLVLARRAGRLRSAGADLAAHCIDDVLCTGAEPLFFLDYVAVGRLDPPQAAELVGGVAAGDVVLGFHSSGLHTNGFSLVRKLVGDGEFDADLLLEPHRLYVDEVRHLRQRADVKALAHVTGGGILGNLSRVLPEGRRAEIDWDAWERPRVYSWLTEQGISEEEQRRVFNVGVGMCAVVPADDVGAGLAIGRIT